MTDPPVRAERVDAELGIREEVEFFDAGAVRLFGCRHLPLGAVLGGLVICSPILSDFGANYSREVRLARRLATAGVAVQRFHPRGTGQSDGDRLDLTFDTLVADSAAAVVRLREAVDVPAVALLGTRFSALAAAAVGRDLPGAPIALWEPTTEPGRFFRDGFRARSVHHLRRGAAGIDPAAELAAQGYVDLLGIPVSRALVETPAHHDLLTEMGDGPRPVLLVQFEAGSDLTRPYREAVARWTAAGFPVTARLCPTDETWWFVHDRLAPVEAVLDPTADWLLAAVAPT
ncbi:MAG: hypothetical protein ACRDWI_01530 [Jiangellaceae bacterium]